MNFISIGIDNGSTGSIGIIGDTTPVFFKTPIKSVPNYQKDMQLINRIALDEFKQILSSYKSEENEVKILIERPFMAPVRSIGVEEFIDTKYAHTVERPQWLLMKKKIPSVDMKFFKSSLNAHRAFEATIILLESLGYGYNVIDSKQWQNEIIGKGIKGSKKLKEASKLKGTQLYPELESAIKKHGDADGLLIAQYGLHYWKA